MEFEWDEKKRIYNLHKHGIDFIGVDKLFDGYTLSIEDDRTNYGEQRFITFGMMQECVVAVVHTECNDTIRIISIRKATKNEQRNYFSQLPY